MAPSPVLARALTAAAALAAALRGTTAEGAGTCDATSDTCDGTAMLQHRSKTALGTGGPSPPASATKVLAGKSVYFLPVDRFGTNDMGAEKCVNDNIWCNGTLRGLIENLDYIQNMGFDCVWITPVVYQWQGQSPSGTGCMGYWAYDLYKIDPHFGTPQDLKDLVSGLHDRDMCIVYDFVANHMGPIHGESFVKEMVPFNETKYFNQLFIGNLSFDEYTAKTSNWPPPAQAMWSQSGAQCTQGRPCSCYVCDDLGGIADPFKSCQGDMVFDPTGPCPKNALSPYCMPGDYQCEGYNETITQQGWFYDLGDLNQSDPFVRNEQKKWLKWFVDEYNIDTLRLDTAAFMTWDFLSELQEAAGVPIIGEVTTTNMTYHASFQKEGGREVLDGVLNFPIYYSALAGFCGKWFPFSTWNLTFLGTRMAEQATAPYERLDSLGNFIDNHDVPRITDTCNHDLNRIKSAVAFTMLIKGVPIMYYGTEELFTEVRESLWDKGFNQSTDMYQYIKSLNAVRKHSEGMPLSSQDVIPSNSDAKLIFTRGGKDKMWVYLNNMASNSSGGVDYCAELPPTTAGYKWVDWFTGKDAVFEGGCFKAGDALPKVLLPEPEATSLTS